MKTSRDIQKLINAIDQGVDVYSGMLHRDRVRMYLKEALQMAEVIEGELNTANNRVDGLQSALDCNRQHYDMQTKSFETLRSENALLNERVKELEEEIKCRREIREDDANRINRLSKEIELRKEETLRLNIELTALKNSKTVYVRRCKNEL